MKKNIGSIIATVIIIAVVVLTAAVAMFAGGVALFGYIQDLETGTEQVQGGGDGGAENLGDSAQESLPDGAEFTDEEVTGFEMPEE